MQILQVGAQNQNAVGRPKACAPLNSPPPTSGAVKSSNSGTTAEVEAEADVVEIVVEIEIEIEVEVDAEVDAEVAEVKVDADDVADEPHAESSETDASTVIDNQTGRTFTGQSSQGREYVPQRGAVVSQEFSFSPRRSTLPVSSGMENQASPAGMSPISASRTRAVPDDLAAAAMPGGRPGGRR